MSITTTATTDSTIQQAAWRRAIKPKGPKLSCPAQASFCITHNFISVTSSSPSSSICTRLCLGVRAMRYGCGVREDWPLYPSREMGSSGGDRMSNAQSSHEIASHSSRSATWMAGQIRRLRAHSSAKEIGGLAGKAKKKKKHYLFVYTIHTLRRTPSDLGPSDRRACSIQHMSMCLLGSAQV